MISHTIESLTNYKWGPANLGRAILMDIGLEVLLEKTKEWISPVAAKLLLFLVFALVVLSSIHFIVQIFSKLYGLVEQGTMLTSLLSLVGMLLLYTGALWLIHKWFMHRRRLHADAMIEEVDAVRKEVDERTDKTKREIELLLGRANAATEEALSQRKEVEGLIDEFWCSVEELKPGLPKRIADKS